MCPFLDQWLLHHLIVAENLRVPLRESLSTAPALMISSYDFWAYAKTPPIEAQDFLVWLQIPS